MKEYWSEKAKRITPYVAGEQPKAEGIIKLNTNENPFPPSPKAIAAIEEYNKDLLRLYPNPSAEILRKAAASCHGVAPENIFCGNGSDEVLALAFQAFFDGGLAICDVTYSFYPVWADMYGIEYEKIPLNEDFTVPVEKFIGKNNVVIANPNAPTSIALAAEEIERIIKSASGVVLIDEAYVEFGAESVIPLCNRYPNLLVVRTLSKSHGLAGLRIGYAVGNENLIRALECIRDSFNSYPLDTLAQIAASEALMDERYTKNISQIIMHTREFASQSLAELGFHVLPAKANFIFARPAGMAAKDLMEELKKRKIFVRWFPGERVRDYLRITVGTHSQMEKLIRETADILGKDIK